MADTATTPPKMKTKPASSAFEMPKFEMPKFEMPKFDIPKVEMPAAFREFAERSVAQAKDTYEKMKAVAEEATDVLETSYSTASKGASDYGMKVIEAARVNTNAAFDFAGELITAKNLSEVMELYNAHARKQFEAFTRQSKELGALAQKVATDTAEPIKSGMTKAFAKVA
jgi:phasin